ncbi:hypothetical protein [Paenibacillus periandrae]|uniref:hypothetical protein n=1 Tax=Paenibacillus periandrae TaxID=1761741 RepID=UPI001F089D26|nr:hypothetical protein [Paenibacillus periandrae]
MAVLLRESERKEEIEALNKELWDKLQRYDETYAEAYYKICLKNVGKEEKVFWGPTFETSPTNTEFFKSKGFWIAALLGVLIVVFLVFFILWFSLITE